MLAESLVTQCSLYNKIFSILTTPTGGLHRQALVSRSQNPLLLFEENGFMLQFWEVILYGSSLRQPRGRKTAPYCLFIIYWELVVIFVITVMFARVPLPLMITG